MGWMGLSDRLDDVDRGNCVGCFDFEGPLGHGDHLGHIDQTKRNDDVEREDCSVERINRRERR